MQKFETKERQIRGVYYTQPPVIRYIISGINEILKDNFDTHEELVDENITLFDFEYMILPFTISYLKLTRMIEDYGFKFTKQDCPKIYLTNTLKETKDPSNLFNLKGIEKHIREIMNVKTTKKILVITGNPPYLKSNKTTDHIKKNIQIEKYYPFSEEQSKQILCNAYIKFVHFVYKRIEKSGLDKVIIGIITLTSYLEETTHRRMKNELLKIFSEIYILDLHGARGVNDNVFGNKKSSHIGEPSCITFFVKNKKKKDKIAKVFYKSTLNWKLIDKYRFLGNNSIKTSDF